MHVTKIVKRKSVVIVKHAIVVSLTLLLACYAFIWWMRGLRY